MPTGDDSEEQVETLVPLFRLDEYHAAGTRFIGEAIEALARAHDPLLAKIKVVKLEGPIDSQITTDEGEAVELVGSAISSPIGWKATDVMVGEFGELLTSIDTAAEAYASSVMQMVFNQIRTVTETTGMIKQVSGPMTWDGVLDMLEMTEWSFDRDGNPNFPDIVTGPDNEMPPMKPHHHERLGQIVERKREEHRAARGTRRLS